MLVKKSITRKERTRIYVCMCVRVFYEIYKRTCNNFLSKRNVHRSSLFYSFFSSIKTKHGTLINLQNRLNTLNFIYMKPTQTTNYTRS